jgi:hypothetical protein
MLPEGYLLYLTISGDNGNHSFSKLESNFIWTPPPAQYRALRVVVPKYVFYSC